MPATDAPRYLVRGLIIRGDDSTLQDELARIHGDPERPRCLCVPGGVEMYVAKHHQYLIKRMPETGAHHHPECAAFEPEPAASGLGELIGEAIIEHAPDRIEIHVDFPLERSPGKPFPHGDPKDPAEVQATRKRMSLRALLHLLYERAGLNRWQPAMAGRRNQGVLCKFLLEAARDLQVKGGPLYERLYVPEPFRLEQKEGIAERRRQKLALLRSTDDDGRFKMALVIGEYNGSEPTPYGRKVLLRHMADAPLFIDAKAWERVERTQAGILAARDADLGRRNRILLAALIYSKREYLYQIDTLALMLISQEWLPLDGLYEQPLIDRLCQQGRSFVKPLQYDARALAHFPNVLLLDSGDVPRPLHVVSVMADPKVRSAKGRAIEQAGEGVWVWTTDQPLPELPARAAAMPYVSSDRNLPPWP